MLTLSHDGEEGMTQDSVESQEGDGCGREGISGKDEEEGRILWSIKSIGEGK